MLHFPETPLYYGAVSLVHWLNEKKHEAYLVGGCVRDVLLGREIADIDITTSAKPEEIMSIFPETIPTGIDFGTVTVLWGGIPYEVTTFRGDGTYSDGRRPDSVVFDVSLEEDLKRRDFTINAMAYHPEMGLIDPFEGAVDLEERILRTVGSPHRRFQEDYLRILRGLRFSATLGFHIEPDTGDGMLCHWEGLINVTRERITQEIRKLVMGEYIHYLGDYCAVLEDGVFYGIDCLWEAEDQGQVEKKLRHISTAPKLLTLRLTLFLSLFYPDSAILKLSKAESKEVDFLGSQPCLAWENQDYFQKLIHKEGREKVKLLLYFQQYHYPYHKMELVALEKQLHHLPATCLKELDVTGQDLLDAGVSAGEMVGKLLHIALDLVISGEVPNEKEALLEMMLGKKEEASSQTPPHSNQ